jgi:hypothetical protein
MLPAALVDNPECRGLLLTNNEACDRHPELRGNRYPTPSRDHPRRQEPMLLYRLPMHTVPLRGLRASSISADR